jgi:plastocyanin
VLRRSWPALAVLTVLAAACGQPDIQVRSESAGDEAFVPLVVDAAGLSGAGVSLATDAEGNPHLSYLTLPDEEAEEDPAEDPLAPTLPAVIHAHFTDNLWTRDPVAEEQEVFEGSETAIVVDADGIHHVAWTAGGSVFYSSNAAGEFAEEPQAVGGTDPVGLSIAADQNGAPMIAFVEEQTEAEGPAALVRVATLDGQQWAVETAAEASPGEPISTAIGVAGDGVLVAYGSEGATQVARQTGARWTSETVDENGGLGLSMDVDADGIAHLSYFDDAGTVEHTHQAGEGWEPPSPVGEGATTSPTSIAVGDDGVHHIVWQTDEGIAYASNAEGDFAEQEFPPAVEGGVRPRAGAGPEGTVYVAWSDPEDGELRMALRSDEEPLLAMPSPESTGAGAPVAACQPEGETLPIVAPQGAVTDGFDKDCLAVEAGQPYTIDFDNQDPGQLHNVNVYTEEGGEPLLMPPNEGTITGPDQMTYEGDPIDEAGEYWFQCDVHPATMVGTFVVAEGQGGGAGAESGDAEGDGGGGGGGGGG